MLFLNRALITLVFGLAGAVNSTAAAPAKPASTRGYQMDYGPFLSYTINCKTGSNAPDNLVLKGIAIKIGANNEHAATVCFDTELMRYAAGWTGGFLNISNTHLNTYKGSEEAFAVGDIFFSTKPEPGWARGDETADPRPLKAGPLPKDWARFKGLYRHGD